MSPTRHFSACGNRSRLEYFSRSSSTQTSKSTSAASFATAWPTCPPPTISSRTRGSVGRYATPDFTDARGRDARSGRFLTTSSVGALPMVATSARFRSNKNRFPTDKNRFPDGYPRGTADRARLDAPRPGVDQIAIPAIVSDDPRAVFSQRVCQDHQPPAADQAVVPAVVVVEVEREDLGGDGTR